MGTKEMTLKEKKESLQEIIDLMPDEVAAFVYDYIMTAKQNDFREMIRLSGMDKDKEGRRIAVDTATPKEWWDTREKYGIEPYYFVWSYDGDYRIFGHPVNVAARLWDRLKKELSKSWW